MKRGKRACYVARIEITRDAERDLIDIYLYGIDEFGLHQAEQYNEVLHGRIETVVENPSFGYVSEGVRRYESVSHAVYYRQIAGSIRVLRVLHGHMDPGRHLGCPGGMCPLRRRLGMIRCPGA